MESGVRIGKEIMMMVKKLELPYQMDEVTLGDGNCFPLAILQQCNRQDIKKSLACSIKSIIEQNNPTLLRRAVYNFIESSQDHQVLDFKLNYEKIVAPIYKKTWNMYWNEMLSNHTWAESVFIQSTAWFLNLDIVIITTTNTKEQPYLTICGHLKNLNLPCTGEKIVLGCKANVHYQSLLPINKNVKENHKKK